VNRYDDPSCAESTKSARTGLEVVHMDFWKAGEIV
jgi:hypothetical protein